MAGESDENTRRGMIVRGEVIAINDSGAAQTLSVRTHEGVERSGIEVMQPFGLAGNAAPGAEVLMLAVGGDEGDMVALPPVHSAARLGGLPAGAMGIYTTDGTRVLTLPDGTVRVQASTRLHASIGATEIMADEDSIMLRAGGVVVKISAAGVQVTGKLMVSESIADQTGTMQAMREAYNAHRNPNNGNSIPDKQMV